MRTIRLGTFSPSVLLEVATGALVDAGLTVVESPAQSSSQQFTDLFEGRLDAVFTNPDNVLAYRLVPDNPLGRTDDVRILGAIDRGLGLSLFTGPARRLGTFGVDVPGSGFAFIGYELLARAGLSRDVDYQVTTVGSTPRRARALIDGAIDCTVLNAGNDLLAEDHGAVRGASVTEIGPYVGTVLAATADSLAHNGDDLSTLLDVVTTTARAIRSHPAIATAAIERRLGLTEATAARHLAILTDPTQGLVTDSTLTVDDLRTIVDLRNRHARSATTLTIADAVASGLLHTPLRR
ncbi:ABC transporter substrate-binding protein [Kutzneria buriramensis]|uniref:ABC-type nitrate/sulfonate/bicarbonate transport system substrate-binding protein n=1 Tax=Kutzneria buriramensis TaxID=1045776 RepID=A0A3E0GUQ0_9PSEU|nr:ABC transporter substrate-binding protein [Kutzneria buriramensis]REH27659.1 ABC-type nitrate/sulfonate/bicarbonate transport system substrate-binding protein [Kutzneria buriramensis]